MSFAAKVTALRRFLGVPETLEMLRAVASMNAMMGIVGEGALPAQVDALIAATGAEVPAAGAAQVLPQACACLSLSRTRVRVYGWPPEVFPL